jgi:endonuclease YncB( thermonuclease family)
MRRNKLACIVLGAILLVGCDLNNLGGANVQVEIGGTPVTLPSEIALPDVRLPSEIALPDIRLPSQIPVPDVRLPSSQTPVPEGSEPRAEGYPAKPEGLENAQVVKVVDGDTLDVDMGGQTVRLRLIGINTPESVDPRQAVECFGREASSKAKELLEGQAVQLEADTSQDERDRYDRLLRYVWMPDGRLFNLEMIAQGYAFEYTYETPYKYQAEFQQAQESARSAQAGLWSPSTCNGEQKPAS